MGNGSAEGGVWHRQAMVVTSVSSLWTLDTEVERALEQEGRVSVLKVFKTSRVGLKVPVGKCLMTVDREVALFHREGHPPCTSIGEISLKQ